MKKEIGHKYLDAIAKNGWHGLPHGFEPGTFNFPIPSHPEKNDLAAFYKKQLVPVYDTIIDDDVPF
jgi:hypothetical protein